MTREPRILIIGAGPAGSALALRLVQLGVQPSDVVVVERRTLTQGLLAPAKVCGDALGNSAIRTLVRLGVPSGEFSRFQPFDSIRFTSPAGTVIVSGSVPGGLGRIIPRDALDGLLAERVRDAGVRLFDGQAAQSIHREADEWGIALAGGEELRGTLLVGADGATSRVAKLIDVSLDRRLEHSDLYVCIRGYASGVRLGTTAWVNLLSGMPGYAWAFPPAGKCNIGVGSTAPCIRRHARQEGLSIAKALQSLLRPLCEALVNEGVAKSVELSDLKVWPVSAGPEFRPVVGEGILLVGDATGGVVSPLTGGGIENAITSSLLAAEVVVPACVSGDFSQDRLRLYAHRLRETLCPRLRRHLRYRKLVERERLINWGFRAAASFPALRKRVLGA